MIGTTDARDRTEFRRRFASLAGVYLLGVDDDDIHGQASALHPLIGGIEPLVGATDIAEASDAPSVSWSLGALAKFVAAYESSEQWRRTAADPGDPPDRELGVKIQLRDWLSSWVRDPGVGIAEVRAAVSEAVPHSRANLATIVSGVVSPAPAAEDPPPDPMALVRTSIHEALAPNVVAALSEAISAATTYAMSTFAVLRLADASITQSEPVFTSDLASAFADAARSCDAAGTLRQILGTVEGTEPEALEAPAGFHRVASVVVTRRARSAARDRGFDRALDSVIAISSRVFYEARRIEIDFDSQTEDEDYPSFRCTVLTNLSADGIVAREEALHDRLFDVLDSDARLLFSFVYRSSERRTP